MISLEPSSPEVFAPAQRRLWDAYRSSWIRAGASAAEADAKTAAVRDAVLPDGRLPANHHPLTVLSGGEVAGFLWLAERVPGDWYVYDLSIEPPHRGGGLGGEVLLAAERFARARGGIKIECNVFASNVAMRRIIDAAGYRVVTSILSKPL